MDAGNDETAAGTRRCSLSCQVWPWEGQMRKKTTAAVEGRVSLAQIYAATATTRQEKRVIMSI